MIFHNSLHAHLRNNPFFSSLLELILLHLKKTQKITFILQPEVKQKDQNTDKTEIEKI